MNDVFIAILLIIASIFVISFFFLYYSNTLTKRKIISLGAGLLMILSGISLMPFETPPGSSASSSNPTFVLVYDGGYPRIYRLYNDSGNTLWAGAGDNNGDADILRSADGETWSVSHTGDANNNTIYDLLNFSDHMYAGQGDNNGEGDTLKNNWEIIGNNWIKSGEFGADIGRVYCLAEYNGYLYAGTCGNHPDDDTNDIWRTNDGISWNQVFDGSTDFGHIKINSLCVYNNTLFAGCGNAANATDSDGDIYLSRDGTTWIRYGDETFQTDYYWSVTCMANFSGKLYAGMHSSVGTRGDIWVYDGAYWNQSYNSSSTSCYDFAVHKGKLFACFKGGNISYLNESTNEWNDIVLSYGGGYELFMTIEDYNGYLYIGAGNGVGDGDVLRWSFPDAPSSFISNDLGGIVNLTWVNAGTTNRTYIEFNATDSSWEFGNGTMIYNDTGTGYDHVTAVNGYYRAWSYNSTFNQYSLDNVLASSARSFGCLSNEPYDKSHTTSAENYMRGIFACPEKDGYAKSITVMLNCTLKSHNVSCALYDFSDYSVYDYPYSVDVGDFIAETEQRSIPGYPEATSVPINYTFNFSAPYPQLRAWKLYYMAVWCNSTTGVVYQYWITSTQYWIYTYNPYGEPRNAWNTTFTGESLQGRTAKMYCTYTEATFGSQTYYVDDGGDDLNDGSICSPFATIQKAVNESADNDTIYIRGGTYTPPKNIYIYQNNLTISAYNNEDVNIICLNAPTSGGAYPPRGIFELDGCYNVRISGLTFNQSANGAITMQTINNYIRIDNCTVDNTSNSAIWIDSDGSSHITIDHCIFNNTFNNWTGLSDSGQECISMINVSYFYFHHNNLSNSMTIALDLKNGCSWAWIHNNTFNTTVTKPVTKIGSILWGGSAIYLDARGDENNISIYNNYFTGNHSGISIDNEEGNGGVDNVSIYNNIHRQDNPTAELCSPPINIRYVSAGIGLHKNIDIRHCTVVIEPTGYQVCLRVQSKHERMQNIVITNTIFNKRNTTYPYPSSVVWFQYINSTDGVSTLTNNLFNRTGPYAGSYCSFADKQYNGTNAILDDPKFVNPNTFDFHLNNTSPCIDAADSTYSVSFDYEENSRPRGNGYDIGAFELQIVSSYNIINEFPLNNTCSAIIPTCNVTIQETHGYTFDYVLDENSTGSWVTRASGSGVSNGSYSFSYTEASSLHNSYWWRVTVTGGGTTINEIYKFVTISNSSILVQVYDGTGYERVYKLYNDSGNTLWAGMGDGGGDADILRSDDGTTWTLSHNAAAANETLYSFLNFSNTLYAGQGDGQDDGDLLKHLGSNTWVFAHDFTDGALLYYRIYSLCEFDEYMYSGAYSATAMARIDRTNDGVTWERNYGGDGLRNMVRSMATYNNSIWAGMGNGAGYGDIIYSTDGTTWVNDSGESYNGTYYRVVNALYNNSTKLYAAMGGTIGMGDILVYDGAYWNMSFNTSSANAYALYNHKDILFCAFTFCNISYLDPYTDEWKFLVNNYDAIHEMFYTICDYNGLLYIGAGSGTNDGDIFTWTFPDSPTDLDAVSTSSTTQLSWISAGSTNYTYIEYNISASDWERGNGTVVYFGMDSSYSYPSLNEYYYKAWSYNVTYGQFSLLSSDSAQAGFYATVRTYGNDYFTWIGDNTSAYFVAANITGFDEASEYISILFNNGTMVRYYGDGGGVNWSIHTFDVVQCYMDDSVGNVTFNITINPDIDYTADRTVTLKKIGNGYNYTGYTNSTIGALSGIDTKLNLATGYYIGLWNRTAFTWNFWIHGFQYNTDRDVLQYDVIVSKIESDKTWNI